MAQRQPPILSFFAALGLVAFVVFLQLFLGLFDATLFGETLTATTPQLILSLGAALTTSILSVFLLHKALLALISHSEPISPSNALHYNDWAHIAEPYGLATSYAATVNSVDLPQLQGTFEGTHIHIYPETHIDDGITVTHNIRTSSNSTDTLPFSIHPKHSAPTNQPSIPTGDADFDATFTLCPHNPHQTLDLLTLLTPELRTAMLSIHNQGLHVSLNAKPTGHNLAFRVSNSDRGLLISSQTPFASTDHIDALLHTSIQALHTLKHTDPHQHTQPKCTQAHHSLN